MTKRPLFAVAVSALVAAGCGGSGPPEAIGEYSKQRWPDGKVLSCEKTGQIAEAGKVWQCAVRRHNRTGPMSKEANAIIDAGHPPVVVCLAVRDDQAFLVDC